MIDIAEFAVVDVETTGLFHRIDRIIEIAVIRVDGNGNLVDEYVTLVNPNRDLGPTHIHGITAKEVNYRKHLCFARCNLQVMSTLTFLAEAVRLAVPTLESHSSRLILLITMQERLHNS
jgi:DNA polymerase III epsilon subunit-like protein